MSYENFAYFYDQLMRDVPYEKWVDLINLKKEKWNVKGKKLLDLACGTGELSVRFAEAGYEVTGIDLSSDMLSIAQTKAEEKGCHIHFYQQNMAELELTGQYDVIGIFCDSLNYLPTEEGVKQTFQRVHHYLQKGGLFIFDVHSVYKMTDVFIDHTYTYDDDEICYIWNCFPGEEIHSVEHELTFFVQDASGKYDRYDENHFQRTFSVETYTKWLTEAGFECLEVLGDFADSSINEGQWERIFFIAGKNE
jgi:ubiquinone/menaquinone biosynthesis C-methylase UbiE